MTTYPLTDSEWKIIEKLVADAQMSMLKASGKGRSGKGFDPRYIAELIVKAVEGGYPLGAVMDPLGHYPSASIRRKYYRCFNESGTLNQMFGCLEQSRPGILAKFNFYHTKREELKEKHAKKEISTRETSSFVPSTFCWGK